MYDHAQAMKEAKEMQASFTRAKGSGPRRATPIGRGGGAGRDRGRFSDPRFGPTNGYASSNQTRYPPQGNLRPVIPPTLYSNAYPSRLAAEPRGPPASVNAQPPIRREPRNGQLFARQESQAPQSTVNTRTSASDEPRVHPAPVSTQLPSRDQPQHSPVIPNARPFPQREHQGTPASAGVQPPTHAEPQGWPASAGAHTPLQGLNQPLKGFMGTPDQISNQGVATEQNRTTQPVTSAFQPTTASHVQPTTPGMDTQGGRGQTATGYRTRVSRRNDSDVTMIDAEPSNYHRDLGERGLRASMWNAAEVHDSDASFNTYQPDPMPIPERREARYPQGPIVASGMAKGHGLQDSRWA